MILLEQLYLNQIYIYSYNFNNYIYKLLELHSTDNVNIQIMKNKIDIHSYNAYHYICIACISSLLIKLLDNPYIIFCSSHFCNNQFVLHHDHLNNSLSNNNLKYYGYADYIVDIQNTKVNNSEG